MGDESRLDGRDAPPPPPPATEAAKGFGPRPDGWERTGIRLLVGVFPIVGVEARPTVGERGCAKLAVEREFKLGEPACDMRKEVRRPAGFLVGVVETGAPPPSLDTGTLMRLPLLDVVGAEYRGCWERDGVGRAREALFVDNEGCAFFFAGSDMRGDDSFTRTQFRRSSSLASLGRLGSFKCRRFAEGAGVVSGVVISWQSAI